MYQYRKEESGGSETQQRGRRWREALDELSSDNLPANSARVVVHGLGEYSGSDSLVAALLTDPFAPHDEALCTPGPRTFAFSIPVEVSVLAKDDPLGATKLALADVPILVTNPLVTSISDVLNDPDLQPMLQHQHAILVILGTVAKDELRDNITNRITSKTSVKKERILFVDPSRALAAVDALRSDPSSSLAVQRYQDDYIASHVSTVTDAVSRSLGSALEPAQTPSLRQLRARAVLAEAEDEIRSVHAQCSELEGEVELVIAKSQHDTLGSSDIEADEASRAWNPLMKTFKDGDTQLQELLRSITWWKLPVQSDGVATTVSLCFKRPWFREVEKHLLLQTGRLSAIQEAQDRETQRRLARFKKTSPFHSPVLENSIAQTIKSPSHPVTTNALLEPFNHRHAQVMWNNGRLHSEGQKVVVGSGTGLVTGAAVTYAGWAGWLSSGLLGSFSGLEAESASVLGVVVTLSSFRWAVGKWEKAKSRWWEDWQRVKETLIRDIHTTISNAIRQQVFAAPMQAREALLALSSRRSQEIEELVEEIEILSKECDDAQK
ncbi:hypothetical protein PUNSTDRAFT_124915 [Punctularia strigosozonata HHB-11173 SS5]|uniref:uncharacterized protein n=1 Tax=Punctularia strigosozonata (strain HHB-11173) TaxID=741275 RepID=UPI0004416A97|nr:uncharacterized protein PUNSTDRAFT_124915 [Punctularia strigosozonata HHB-11173 SS5]EIN11668.1 hypothetical protein PUNSTDRAFT_124915 [Punctularia strigosozonata HHB-11173 SS5]